MACHLLGDKPLPEPMRSENLIKIQNFSLKKISLEMVYAEWGPLCLGFYVLLWTPLLRNIQS